MGGGTAKNIAPGCTDCNDRDLDKFLRYIESPPGKTTQPWTGSTGLTGPWTGTEPGVKSVNDIADAISKSGYACVTENYKIVPSKLTPSDPKTFEKLYTNVNSFVQDFRKTVPDSDDRIVRITKSMTTALNLRSLVNAADVEKTINAVSAAQKWGITAVMNADGTINSEATLATAPKQQKNAVKFVGALVSQKPLKQGLNADLLKNIRIYANHCATVGHLEAIVSDLNKPVVCSPSVKVRRWKGVKSHVRQSF